MERLTNRINGINWIVRDIPWNKIPDELNGAMCKLRDYEDTGLTPERVKEINSFDGSQAIKYLALYQEEQRNHCWVPVADQLPEDSGYILLSFSNFSLPMVGRYERSKDGGAFYLGDCDEEDTCVSNDLFVNAWMPLPKPYREERCHETKKQAGSKS